MQKILSLALLALLVTLSESTCSRYCQNGESHSTDFKTRVANANDLVVVEVTSDPEPRPAIGHAGQFSYIYTATVRKVLKGCLAPGDSLRIHQIRKLANNPAGCPNPILGNGAEISIWTGKPKKAQAVRSSPVPRLLTPKNGMFLISGCRVLKDPEVFFLNPCGIAQAVSTDWELVAIAGNANVRSLLGAGTWSEVLLKDEKTATVQSIWTESEKKRQVSCATTPVWCASTHPGASDAVAVDVFKAHRLALVTAGGKWVANQYKVMTGDPGAIMELEFIPNSNIAGTKIGLIQKNLKIEKGKNYDTLTRAKILADRQNSLLPKSEQKPPQPINNIERRKDARGDGVSHIDRHAMMNNPIYGAPDLRLGNPGDAIDATPVGNWNPGKVDPSKEMGNYQLGGVVGGKVTAARLYDAPNCLGCLSELEGALKKKDDPLPFSSFTFETTAVVIAGADFGKYLGSVEWGFTIDPNLCVQVDDDFTCSVSLLPFVVKSQDNASPDFKGVVAAWNAGFFDYSDPTKPDKRNPQLPVVP